MSPTVALFICLIAIVWLFVTDRRRHEEVSGALWIPLMYVLIIATRSPSAWLSFLGGGGAGGGEDSTYSMLMFLALFSGGFWILSRRRVDWQTLFSSNKWLFIYLLYVAASVIWSDQPFTSGKLWIKAAGSILMVLIILSERDPTAAVKSIFLRSSYLLVVFSYLFVNYYPALGRSYDEWTFQPTLCGACTNKNSLGAALVVCTLGMFWSLLEPHRGRAPEKWNTLVHIVLLAMAFWLLVKSHCATALACVIVGSGILLGMRLPRIRSVVHRLGVSAFIVVALVLVCLNLVFDIRGGLVDMLGRDATLTGRTGIWKATLQADVNPLVGVGYRSFWHGERARVISEAQGFFFVLQEAHNGYIEVYLDGGLLRLSLLLIAIASGASKIVNRLADDDSYTPFRLAFVTVALIYSVTESAFDGLNPIWFVFLLVLVDYPSDENLGWDTQDEFRETGIDQPELCEEFGDASGSCTLPQAVRRQYAADAWNMLNWYKCCSSPKACGNKSQSSVWPRKYLCFVLYLNEVVRRATLPLAKFFYSLGNRFSTHGN
jgi:exopolysaccharide production protein ExoQ